MAEDTEALYAALRGENHRRALGRAITLVEGTRPADRRAAAALLARIEADPPAEPGFRLGISGAPGVGKSTFIERFGLELVGRGHRLAVLAIDPTSGLSGGSILGDKTRMEELARRPEVYIRPSPSAGQLGGIGPAGRAAVLVCAAAGYDYVIVETVGVGQAEWRVHGLTDAFLLLAQPAAGDDLQGIKRGILELADHLVVNKADRLPDAARLTASQFRLGLHLAPPRADGWTVEVATASALTGAGVAAVADRLAAYREHLVGRGLLAARRREQRLEWVRETLRRELLGELDRYLSEYGPDSDGLAALLDQHTTIFRTAGVLLTDFFKTKTIQQ